ncbi:unnamed protein product, partial [Symbiodinium necroappetens]
AVAPPGGGGSTTTVYAFDDRPEQSNAQAWVEEVGGVATSVRTIECADLLRLFGQAVYMKIDVESSTIDCLDSLVQSQRDAPGRQPVLPKFLSMELEAASLFNPFHRKLKELGYLFYKACRQYVYSPSPCEQGRYSREVPGCGSGPFGVAAVDYLRGLRWSPIDELPTDTQWVEEFEKGLDWPWPYAGDLVLMRLGILEKRKVRLACHASGIDPISKSREKGAYGFYKAGSVSGCPGPRCWEEEVAERSWPSAQRSSRGRRDAAAAFLHQVASGMMVEKDPQAGMLPRFLSSRKVMPTGLVSLLGLMALAYNCMQLRKWWDPEDLPFIKLKA